jgi:hypothetical protein
MYTHFPERQMPKRVNSRKEIKTSFNLTSRKEWAHKSDALEWKLGMPSGEW